ncbi:hypothetical protein QUF70_13490, partial [Desulfobacterales bacterium HSG17]|nr:hypothetical protein [Desulfobacterales bacterium HSG17]
NENVHVEIKPRLFCEASPDDINKLFNHLIYYATNIFIPPSKTKKELFKSENFSLLLLTLIWKGALEHALSKNYIPKNYVEQQRNLKTLRGRIDFTRHIRKNMIDKSRFYCNFQELTFDITINRTIRHVCEILYQDNVLSTLLGDLSGHEERLASFGVQNKTTPLEIDNIVYNRMNEEYRRVMALSKWFLLWQGTSENGQDSEKKYPYCFFIDLAELWENYLLNILRHHLSKQYQVYSPNFETDEIYMLKNHDEDSRLIRPDIIIKKRETENVVAVLDAKYKDYREFGNSGRSRNNPNSVSKDDFYQMNSYLLHYLQKENNNRKLSGLFVSPTMIKNSADQDEIITSDIHTYKKNPDLQIGLVNLPFQQLLNHWDNVEKVHKAFCRKIEKLIGGSDSTFVT